MKRIGAGVQAVDYEGSSLSWCLVPGRMPYSCCFCAGNMVYTMVQSDGLGVVVTTDKEYPARVAVTMAKELIAQFKTVHGCVPAVAVGYPLLMSLTALPRVLCWLVAPCSAVWRSTKADFACRFPRLDEAMQEYQDPTKVDKIMKVDKQVRLCRRHVEHGRLPPRTELRRRCSLPLSPSSHPGGYCSWQKRRIYCTRQ